MENQHRKSRTPPFLYPFHFDLSLLCSFLLPFSNRLRVVHGVIEGCSLEPWLDLGDSNSHFLLFPERLTQSLVDLILLRYFMVIRREVAGKHIFFLKVPTLLTFTISAITLPKIEETTFWQTLRMQNFDIANFFLDFLIRFRQEGNNLVVRRWCFVLKRCRCAVRRG